MSQLIIQRNLQHKGIEIVFPGAVNKAASEALKANKFRYHSVRKLWYSKFKPESEAFATKIKVLFDRDPALLMKEAGHIIPPAAPTPQPEPILEAIGGGQEIDLAQLPQERELQLA
jgi:hypothetical protein